MTFCSTALYRWRGSRHLTRWRAELLDELPPAQRPQPFTEIEHRFDTLEEVVAWLGDATIADSSWSG
jgi:hypothetical protein